MNRMSEFADNLAAEALADMADSFFGERRDIDDEVELFQAKAQRLHAHCETALSSAAVLHALLRDGESAMEFYRILGVPGMRLLRWVDPLEAHCQTRPWGLSARHRFVKLFLSAYAQMWEDFDAYLNGRYFTEPGSSGSGDGGVPGGAKRLTMHYKLLRDWAGHINRRIRNVNEGHAPSCVLGFVRSMDVIAEQQADVAGATLDDYACKLDQDLSLPFVDLLAMGVKELPELPVPASVDNTLRGYAADLYIHHYEEIDEILMRIRECPPCE